MMSETELSRKQKELDEELRRAAENAIREEQQRRK